MKKRVVVTGLGAVTPIGNTVEEFWQGIRRGEVGIGPITKFDTSDYKVKLAAEVKGFSPKERMDFKAAKRMETFSQYAVAAAKEAFEDAGLNMEEENPYRAGVIIGSGIGSLQTVESNYEKILTKGPSRVNPLMVPLMISNMAAGNVSIQLGFQGKCTNVVTACASGTHCIGDAFRAIAYGDLDICVAGGTESAWLSRKMYQCSDCMCVRHPLHWRCLPCHCLRRFGHLRSRRNGEQHLPNRSGRIYSTYSTFHITGS